MALMAQIIFKRGSVTYYGSVSYGFNLPFLFHITLRCIGTGVPYDGRSVRSITNISLILSAVLEAKHKKAVLLDDSQRCLTLQSHRRQNLV